MVDISCFSQSRKKLKFTPFPLPLDILINHVFVELPVSSLAHCRCVCKQWLRALTEPDFIRLHHNRQVEKPHNRKILCGPIFYDKFPYCQNEISEDHYEKREAFRGVFYSLDLESSSVDVESVRLLGFPLQQTDYYVYSMLGYSNGMACMDTRKKGMGDSISRHLLFGNPSTGVYNLLPDPITGCLFGGFGYDSSSDDYKFVRVVDGMTRIFSLKSSSWRIIGYSPSEIVVKDTNIGCVLDGSIYWLLKGSNKILSFDLKDELFLELLPLPSKLLPTVPVPVNMKYREMYGLLPPLIVYSRSEISMKVVEGSVCIIETCYTSSEVVMWSLFNEGETYFWKKLMNVTLPPFWRTMKLDPVCFTEDGKILCFVVKCLEEICYILVDPKTKKIEDFTIPKLSHNLLKEYYFKAHLSGYFDTLVSPY